MAQAGFTAIKDDLLLAPYQVTNIDAYRNKTFSCLHGIPEDAYQRGMERLEADLAEALPGGIPGMERTTLLWGQRSVL